MAEKADLLLLVGTHVFWEVSRPAMLLLMAEIFSIPLYSIHLFCWIVLVFFLFFSFHSQMILCQTFHLYFNPVNFC